jgi:hypothetical protein
MPRIPSQVNTHEQVVSFSTRESCLASIWK